MKKETWQPTCGRQWIRFAVLGALLVLLSVLLLIRWELTVWLRPERFSEAVNDSLSCANCSEKLCHHKKQLRHFWKQSGQRFHLAGNQIISTAEEVKNKLQQKIEKM